MVDQLEGLRALAQSAGELQEWLGSLTAEELTKIEELAMALIDEDEAAQWRQLARHETERGS
jgi:hypothetical protein